MLVFSLSIPPESVSEKLLGGALTFYLFYLILLFVAPRLWESQLPN